MVDIFNMVLYYVKDNIMKMSLPDITNVVLSINTDETIFDSRLFNHKRTINNSNNDRSNINDNTD